MKSLSPAVNPADYSVHNGYGIDRGRSVDDGRDGIAFAAFRLNIPRNRTDVLDISRFDVCAALSDMSFLMVPSTPEIGSEETNSGICGEFHICFRTVTKASVETDVVRERPLPLSILSEEAGIFREAAHS